MYLVILYCLIVFLVFAISRSKDRATQHFEFYPVVKTVHVLDTVVSRSLANVYVRKSHLEWWYKLHRCLSDSGKPMDNAVLCRQ